jgi:hypothetical protein
MRSPTAIRESENPIPGFDIAAISCGGGCLTARFCVWPIIGTRKLVVSVGDGKHEAALPGMRSAAESVVRIGRGRKLSPTLFETHSEKSVATSNKTRKLNEFDWVCVLVTDFQNFTRVGEAVEVKELRVMYLLT